MKAKITVQREPKLLLGISCIDRVDGVDPRIVDSYVDYIVIAKYSDRTGYLYRLVGNLEQKQDLRNYRYRLEDNIGRSVLTKRIGNED